MKRQLNYTGRVPIPGSAIGIDIVTQPDGTRVHNARFDQSRLKFDAQARVFLEAIHERTLIRFDYGTVGNLAAPHDLSLSEIPGSDVLFFRLKVVDEAGDHGRLLGVADGLRAFVRDAITERDRESLLPVSFVSTLGERVWRVNFHESGGPVLEINSTIPGIREAVRDNPMFLSLVFPAVLREVLGRIIQTEEVLPTEASWDSWQGRWLAFALSFAPRPQDEPDDDAWDEWIDGVVSEFAARHRTATQLSTVLGGDTDGD